MNKCDKCDKVFSSASSLRKHHARKNKCDVVHKCNKCDKIFKNNGKLARHLRRKTPCDVVLNDPARYRCARCDRSYSTNTNLNKHLTKCVAKNNNMVELIKKYGKEIEMLKRAIATGNVIGNNNNNIVNNINNNNINNINNIQNIHNNIVNVLNAAPEKELITPFQYGLFRGNLDLVPEEITEIIKSSHAGDIQSQQDATVALVLKTFSDNMRSAYCIDPDEGIMVVLMLDMEGGAELDLTKADWELQNDIPDKIIKRMLDTSRLHIFKRGEHMNLYKGCDTSNLSKFMHQAAVERIPPGLTQRQSKEYQKAIDYTRMSIRRGIAIPKKYTARCEELD
jgi:hypothetical protein